MNILTRNTDYALRLMVNLARNHGGRIASSRKLSEEEDVSYQLTCKLLQRLHTAGLVASKMGPTGGFFLSKTPAEINLTAILDVIQGPVKLNRCLLGKHVCVKQSNCLITKQLAKLQAYIDDFFNNMTLEDLLKIN